MDPRPHHEEVGENWQPALLTERVIASRALTFRIENARMRFSHVTHI